MSENKMLMYPVVTLALFYVLGAAHPVHVLAALCLGVAAFAFFCKRYTPRSDAAKAADVNPTRLLVVTVTAEVVACVMLSLSLIIAVLPWASGVVVVKGLASVAIAAAVAVGIAAATAHMSIAVLSLIVLVADRE